MSELIYATSCYCLQEVGHQFGQHHTFGGTGGSCNNWFVKEQAVEVGSGVTVLSYAGLCGDGQERMPYFHAVTLRSIARYLQPGLLNGLDFARCGTLTNSSNHRPDVTVIPQCRIPRSTPYHLRSIIMWAISSCGQS